MSDSMKSKNGCQKWKNLYCCVLSKSNRGSHIPIDAGVGTRQSASRRPWHENFNRLRLNDIEVDDDVAEKYDIFDVDVDFQYSRRRESHGGGGDLCSFVSHTENSLGKWSAFSWESIAVVIVRCHCGIFVENFEIEYSRENELSRRARRPCHRRGLTITIFLSISFFFFFIFNNCFRWWTHLHLLFAEQNDSSFFFHFIIRIDCLIGSIGPLFAAK